jgi:hypothetical protein
MKSSVEMATAKLNSGYKTAAKTASYTYQQSIVKFLYQVKFSLSVQYDYEIKLNERLKF